jgi:hypothetical protein
MGRQHKSNRGKMVDMNKLILRHSKDIAVGNSRQNARGDILGINGKIIKSAETVASEYYNTTVPKQTKNVSIKADPLTTEDNADWEEAMSVEAISVDEPAAPTVEDNLPTNKRKVVKSVMNKSDRDVSANKQTNDDWVEDKDGNFVKEAEPKKEEDKK